MFQGNGADVRSNEELTRQLFRRETRRPAPREPWPAQAEPLASRKAPFDVGNQSWSLGKGDNDDKPVTEIERRALFSALSRGSRANLGREPTVAELLQLVQHINAARELVASARAAIDGTQIVFIQEDGRPRFRKPGGSSPRPAANKPNAA